MPYKRSWGRVGHLWFFESHHNSNLWPRLENTILEGLNSSLGSQIDPFFPFEIRGGNPFFGAAILPKQPLLGLETPGKALTIMLLSPFAGLLYYPSSFILPLDPMKGQRWSPISIFNDLKRKISHQFFFSLFMAILNFSNPKLWFSIYLFNKCSEGTLNM